PPDGTRVSLRETRAACCRNSTAQLGGPPWRSLAHSFSAWRSTKTRLRSPLGLKIMVLRSPLSELLAPARVTAINAYAKGHRKAPPLIFVYEAGPCGAWLSRSLTHKGDDCWGVAPSLSPPNQMIGSTPTAETPDHWPGSPARVSSLWSLAPRGKMKPSGISPGRVKMPFAISKMPSSVSKPFC